MSFADIIHSSMSMEPNTNNASGKIITALIIGLIVGFLAGAFWQARRLPTSASDTAAAVLESASTGTAVLDASAKEETKVNAKKETAGDAKAAVTGVPSVNTSVTSPSALTLKVADQLAGDSVFVSVTGVVEPVWVAVREMKDGKVGNILGAHKVFTGENNSAIELLRPTVAGATYTVVLYKDIGDPAFNYREDVLVEGIEATFKAK